MSLESKIEIVGDFVEKIKNFVTEQLRPEMTLEKIKKIVSPHLDELITKHEERGLTFSNGKFSVKYASEKHFQFEFEMYFQDKDGKWHKCINESKLRDAELLEKNTWATIKALKVITFPIDPPERVDSPTTHNEKKFADSEEDAYKNSEGWRAVEDWFNEFLPKLKTEFKYKGIAEYAAKLFSSVDGSTLHLVYKLYYKENGKWVGKDYVKKYNLSEVPAWAKEGLTVKENDVTNRYEKMLGFTI